MVPLAATSASTAAGDSGARPRLVCTRTPVALSTGCRLLAVPGQRGEDGVDGVRRRDLAVPDPLLHLLDGVLDQAAAQPLAGLGQPRVGEQRVGARHVPPGVGAHRYAA